MVHEFEPRWIVAKAQSRRESWAAENVAKQGYEYYLPKIAKLVKTGKQELLVPKPLFPRYLFVRTNGEWRFLLGTFGVMGIVMRGDKPDLLPNSVIEDLKRREIDGYVVLPSRTEDFIKGQKVKVNKGPLADKVGIYEGMSDAKRGRVLLDFLGRKVPTLIANSDLESY